MTKLKNILIMILCLIVLACCVLGLWANEHQHNEIRHLKEQNATLTEELKTITFQYGTLKLTNNDLRLDIADRELEIIKLKAESKAYDELRELTEILCLKSMQYINVLQLRLMEVDEDYGFPRYLYRDVMTDIINKGIE